MITFRQPCGWMLQRIACLRVCLATSKDVQHQHVTARLSDCPPSVCTADLQAFSGLTTEGCCAGGAEEAAAPGAVQPAPTPEQLAAEKAAIDREKAYKNQLLEKELAEKKLVSCCPTDSIVLLPLLRSLMVSRNGSYGMLCPAC